MRRRIGIPAMTAMLCAGWFGACVGQDAPRPTAEDKRKVAENTLSEAPDPRPERAAVR